MIAAAIALTGIALAGCADPVITDVFETDTASPTASDQPTETPLETADAGVVIALPGLPIGSSGIATDVGGDWCVSLFWNDPLPDGVSLAVDAIAIDPATPGAVVPGGCEGQDACTETTITRPGDGCAVVLAPEDPAAALLRFRLDGTLTCPDQSACDAAAIVPDEEWNEVERPEGTTGGDA